MISVMEILTEVKFFKWIPKDLKKGALHRELNIPEDEKIPRELLLKKKHELETRAKGRKLSKKELKTLRRVNLALTFRGMKKQFLIIKLGGVKYL